MTADPLCTQTRLARVVRVGLLAFGAGGAYIAAALVYSDRRAELLATPSMARRKEIRG